MQESPSENDRRVTHTCTLRFKDGQTVSGRICAHTRYEDCVIEYTGAVDRLPFTFETADSVLLRAYFQCYARELKAHFREEKSGDWPRLESADDDLNAHGSPG